jgi:hypothetical protein
MVNSISNDLVRFTLNSQTGSWHLADLRVGVEWCSRPAESWLRLLVQPNPIPLQLAAVKEDAGALRTRFASPDGVDPGLELVFRLVGPALKVYVLSDSRAFPALELFTAGLDTTAAQDGQALLPIRMGLLIPALGEHAFSRQFTNDYESLDMAMAGMFKSGAALLAAWHDPYLAVNISRVLDSDSRLSLSFELSKTARSIELICLGPGDYHTLASAYRQRATELGYRVPWSEKLKERPQAARLFGASNFKLWTALHRRIDENLVEQSVEVYWTFDEVARIAEHLKQDLKLEEILFHLGGWTRFGYDVRHPDNMPANPECGGDAGLADCSRRVKDCGYLFCLHDNYQDIYRDSPSWADEWIQKQPDGSYTRGGVWLGGQAFYTCSRQALRLAQRPDNLPLIKAVANPDVYFIDTTYAVGPQECHDPSHPLTRQEDIHWKQALSDYARQVFGLFGSECGREWAVPHADFFEGLCSVSGGYFSYLKLEDFDARVVPLFDLVYHDCITIHGKYGYQPSEMAEQVAHHAAIGRTLYYHSVGRHLYWQEPGAEAELPLSDQAIDPALYTRAHNGWAESLCQWDRFIKNTHEILSPLSRRAAQSLIERYEFLDPDRRVRRTRFENGIEVIVNSSQEDVPVVSPLWGEVVLPPFGLLVSAGDFSALVCRSAADGKPALFTLTSLDGKTLGEAARVRVFHGFGSSGFTFRGHVHDVRTEATLEL